MTGWRSAIRREKGTSFAVSQRYERLPVTYVDLFSGAGGMSLGFKMAGFENIFSVDCDHDSCETYRENMPAHMLVEANIESISDDHILKMANGREVDIVIGGTPCQGFSMAGSIGRKFIDDPRNHLFREFARVVRLLRPKFFVIENVARLYTHNGGRTCSEILSLFANIGYGAECKVLNAADFGIPQHRRRILIIGNRLGLANKFPDPTHMEHVPIKAAIDSLPVLYSGESSHIPNHTAMNHTAQMLEKMSFVQDGGTKEMIPECVRPRSGDVRKYMRYNSHLPSVCVTGDMRKVFHYSQNRALTVRELARIQSFPDDFVFSGSSISRQQQVGNAVPPKLALALAKTLKQHLITKQGGMRALEPGIIPNRFPKINFIGNKQKMAEWIFDSLDVKPGTFFDAFAGGCSVSFEAKRRGHRVITNDILRINHLIGKALIENTSTRLDADDVDLIFRGAPKKGFMYRNYSNVIFYPGECMELDQYRENIMNLKNPSKIALAFVLLRRAMIRKMPYSRFTIPWDKVRELRNEKYSYEKYGRARAYHNKTFKEHFLGNLDSYNMSVFDNGHNNKSHNMDVFELLPKVRADVIYLDPPYVNTMNNYHGFYGALDDFVEEKITEPFKNNFVKKQISVTLFDRLLSRLKNFKCAILSYNNNSYPDIKTMEELIARYSDDVTILTRKHNYQITGSGMKSRNKECLFVIRNPK